MSEKEIDAAPPTRRREEELVGDRDVIVTTTPTLDKKNQRSRSRREISREPAPTRDEKISLTLFFFGRGTTSFSPRGETRRDGRTKIVKFKFQMSRLVSGTVPHENDVRTKNTNRTYLLLPPSAVGRSVFRGPLFFLF